MDNYTLEKLIFDYIRISNTINYQIYYKIRKKIMRLYYFNYKLNEFQFVKNLMGYTNEVKLILILSL